MNSLIQSHNKKTARLAALCSARRSIELDFFTEASNNYKSYIMGNVAFNPYENPSLTEMVKQDFINEAQNPETGIIRLQTRLNIEKNSTVNEIETALGIRNDHNRQRKFFLRKSIGVL